MPQEKSVVFKEDFERMISVVEEKITATGKPLLKILLTDGHACLISFSDSIYFCYIMYYMV
jgi:hypothetical protein